MPAHTSRLGSRPASAPNLGKIRQVGATKTDTLDSVLKASPAEAKFDVWAASRDELQARLYLEDCYQWAKILHLAATDLGMVFLDPKTKISAQIRPHPLRP